MILFEQSNKNKVFECNGVLHIEIYFDNDVINKNFLRPTSILAVDKEFDKLTLHRKHGVDKVVVKFDNEKRAIEAFDVITNFVKRGQNE